MFSNNQLLSWSSFLHSLETQFTLSLFEDPRGAFFKLSQTSNVVVCQAQFESLENRIMGLQPQFYLSCFISSLKPSICQEVQAFQPLNLTQAISLTKLQKEKHLDNRTQPFYHQNTQPSPTNTNFRATLTVNPPKTLATKRISPAELQECRDKGLCYNYNKQFTRGHHCKCQIHLLIIAPEPTPPLDDFTAMSLIIIPTNSETPCCTPKFALPYSSKYVKKDPQVAQGLARQALF